MSATEIERRLTRVQSGPARLMVSSWNRETSVQRKCVLWSRYAKYLPEQTLRPLLVTLAGGSVGTWLRELNGYRRSYRQDITFRELAREFPHMPRPRSGALVPDPWDDYCRRDLDDRTWKRHRTIRYRVKCPGRARETRPKVIYDSPWFEKRYWYFGLSRPGRLIQFRVRFAYRRHKHGGKSKGDLRLPA